ncbi:radical SAM protein [Candidatus Bipolaricaulis anaerobius]
MLHPFFNLRCSDCYAEAHPRPGSRRGPRTLGRPARRPLRRPPPPLQERRDDVLDLVARHRRFLYLLFTNGTLITLDVAQRLGKLGNLTPAISVEGGEEITDRRRGNGRFRGIQQAMTYLRAHGVPFGISLTVTWDNVGEVLSDPFLDLFFEEEGAFYGILLRYLPIGRRPDLNRMLTPAQPVELWR